MNALNRFRYVCEQSLARAIYNKRKYAIFIISFYIGLLLPALCLANMRYVEQTVAFNTFDRMQDAVVVDWFADEFDSVVISDDSDYSISAHYEETFAGQSDRYLPITSIDENYYRPMPSVIGRGFSASDHREGNLVCLISKKDAEALSLGINDTVMIKDVPITIIGLIDNTRYDGLMLPYSTMKKLYSGIERVQLSATIISESGADKEKIIQNITDQIDGMKETTSLISVSDGEDLYNNAMQDAMSWRLLRLAIAAVAIAFFLINESLILLGKLEMEKRTVGVLLSLGAERGNINAEMIIDSIIIVIPAAICVILSVVPLAKVAGIDSAISTDGYFVGMFLLLSVILCAICSYILIRKTESRSIPELIGSQE